MMLISKLSNIRFKVCNKNQRFDCQIGTMNITHVWSPYADKYEGEFQVFTVWSSSKFDPRLERLYRKVWFSSVYSFKQFQVLIRDSNAYISRFDFQVATVCSSSKFWYRTRMHMSQRFDCLFDLINIPRIKWSSTCIYNANIWVIGHHTSLIIWDSLVFNKILWFCNFG